MSQFYHLLFIKGNESRFIGTYQRSMKLIPYDNKKKQFYTYENSNHQNLFRAVPLFIPSDWHQRNIILTGRNRQGNLLIISWSLYHGQKRSLPGT